MPPFEALRAFDATARHRGIRKAAIALDRDHAVVSRHIRSLEKWLGVRLMERRPSGAILTADGEKYHAAIAMAMDDICRASLELLKQGSGNELTIYCAPGFASHWLSGKLSSFANKNSELALVIKPSECSPDFSFNEADLDIQFHATYAQNPLPPSSVKTYVLARVPIVAVCSPVYLKNHAPIREPRDLLSHNLLHEDDFEAWKDWLRAYGVEQQDDAWSGLRLSQGHITLEMARSGNGIALANHLMAARELARGQLVVVGRDSDKFPPLFGEYTLSMRADRWDDYAPRRFRQWLCRTVAQDLGAEKLAAY